MALANARPQEQIDDHGAPRLSHQLQWEIDVSVSQVNRGAATPTISKFL